MILYLHLGYAISLRRVTNILLSFDYYPFFMEEAVSFVQNIEDDMSNPQLKRNYPLQKE